MLPTISIILEKALHPQLYAYLKNNGILTSKQFGFRPNLSTGTALAHFTDNILQNMDAGSFTGALFLDLSKAFDPVDHPLLLQKLTNIGLTTSTTQWFRSHLTIETGRKLHRLEMLTLHLPKCLLEYPKAVYWDLYCF